MEKKLDDTIEDICDRLIENDFKTDDYTKTIEALAKLVTARAELEKAKY